MSRLHTNFVEVKVHTAKCDSCEAHNKGTLYRCTECGQHVCSFCWTLQSGDKTHVYGSGSRVADGEQEDEKGGTRQARIRRQIVISDDEDDDLPMLTPAQITNQAEMNGANSQHRDGKIIIIDNDQHEDRQDDLSTLWPIAQARKLPVLRPADPTANTSVKETVDQMGQRHSHIHRPEFRAGRHKLVQDYDNLERQAAPTRHAFVDDDRELARQAHLLSSARVPRQQAPYPTPLQAQPASFDQRLRDKLAAQHQYTFTSSKPAQWQAPDPNPLQFQPAGFHRQLRDDLMARNQSNIQPAQRQATDPTHSLNAHERATQLAVRQTQHPSYRPRPGVNVHQQAAHGQYVFADGQDVDHQHRAPNRESFSRQDPVPLDPRPAQASIPLQNAQMAAYNRHAFLINQQAQAQARARAMSMEARNRQAMGVYRTLPPNSSGDQVAAHHRQTFASKQQSPSTRNFVQQNMTARDQQEDGLSRKQAYGSHPGPPQTPYQYQDSTKSSPLSPQVCLSQQHAALPASRQAPNPATIQTDPERPSGIHQVREHSPGILAAAETLVAYARVDQNLDAFDHRDQDLTAVSQLVSAAGQLSKASSVSSKSTASPKTIAQSPRPPVSNHAATYLRQWNSGRAVFPILSPSPQLYTTGSSSPPLQAGSTPGVRDTNVGASDRFPGPIPSFLADSRAKKHQRDEKKSDRKISKEHKASGDVDVVDARGRNSKASRSGQIDDNGGDIEKTLREKQDSSRTKKDKGEAIAVPKGLKYVKNFKKGVGYVKKTRGRKVKSQQDTLDESLFWSQDGGDDGIPMEQ